MGKKQKNKQGSKPTEATQVAAGQAAADAGTSAASEATEAELNQESPGDDESQDEAVTGDDIEDDDVDGDESADDDAGELSVDAAPADAPGTEVDGALPDVNGERCAFCEAELGENAAGAEDIDGLFCSTECLAAFEAEKKADEDAAAGASKAGALLGETLQAGTLDQALAAGQAAADAGADIRSAVAGVLDVIVDAVTSQVDADEQIEPRPSYDALLELSKTDAEVEVRLRRGRHSPQLVAGLICDHEWRKYRVAAVADYSLDRSYLRALAFDDSILVRLVG
jgi:hypothetical protein